MVKKSELSVGNGTLLQHPLNPELYYRRGGTLHKQLFAEQERRDALVATSTKKRLGGSAADTLVAGAKKRRKLPPRKKNGQFKSRRGGGLTTVVEQNAAVPVGGRITRRESGKINGTCNKKPTKTARKACIQRGQTKRENVKARAAKKAVATKRKNGTLPKRRRAGTGVDVTVPVVGASTSAVGATTVQRTLAAGKVKSARQQHITPKENGKIVGKCNVKKTTPSRKKCIKEGQAKKKSTKAAAARKAVATKRRNGTLPKKRKVAKRRGGAVGEGIVESVPMNGGVSVARSRAIPRSLKGIYAKNKKAPTKKKAATKKKPAVAAKKKAPAKKKHATVAKKKAPAKKKAADPKAKALANLRAKYAIWKAMCRTKLDPKARLRAENAYYKKQFERSKKGK